MLCRSKAGHLYPSTRLQQTRDTIESEAAQPPPSRTPVSIMFGATRRWFNRNRTPIAIGAGLIGAGYVVTQYVVSKLNDARERMSSDRIAKEK